MLFILSQPVSCLSMRDCHSTMPTMYFRNNVTDYMDHARTIENTLQLIAQSSTTKYNPLRPLRALLSKGFH